MEEDQRDGEEREPDVRAQPALHPSDPPERDFLAHSEERGEKKNREGDCAEDQPEWSSADGLMQRRRLTEERGQMQSVRRPLRVKVCYIKSRRNERRETNENEPGNVFPIKDAHEKGSGFRVQARRADASPLRV
jgi:hypothetical protein